MLNFKELNEIKGDASFRKFFRNKNNRSMVIYAKKEKVKNLLIYDAVNKILNKNKILAPKLLNQNYKNNYIEVEDFGDDTLFKVLKHNKTNKDQVFRKILKTLDRLQLIKDKQIVNFKSQKFKLQEYDNKILSNEAKLFSEWYAPTKINKFQIRKFKKGYENEVKKLLSKLNLKNDTFVHRDFHVSNLMLSLIHI